VDSVIGACMMVRKEAMADVGVLDEDYFIFLEETDWCFRMYKKGWKVYHVPDAEVFHFINLILNILGNLITLFQKEGLRNRLLKYYKLFVWHLLMCPDSMGIQKT